MFSYGKRLPNLEENHFIKSGSKREPDAEERNSLLVSKKELRIK